MANNWLEARRSLRELQGNQDPVKSFAIEQAMRTLEDAGVKGFEMFVENPIETQTPKTPEAPVGMQLFPNEFFEFLKKKGMVHYSLNGQSVEAQKLCGRPFNYIVDAGKNFLTLPSIPRQVAFHPDPDKFFIPRSNKLTLPQQQEITDEYSHKIQREFGSDKIKVAMLDAAGLALLTFLHLDATEEYLFGEKYSYNFARTNTPTGTTDKPWYAIVGNFDAEDGLCVGNYPAGLLNECGYAVRTIVPA